MFSKVLDTLLNFIAPKNCYVCHSEGSFLCEKCRGAMFHYSPYCYVCKKPSEFFNIHNQCKSSQLFYDRVIVFTRYRDNAMKKLLHDGKYYGRKEIYGDFAPSLSELLKNNMSYTNDVILTCPPMHFFRRVWRGYNQSECLGRLISKNAGILANFYLLKKVHQTTHQSHLSKSEREKNLSGTFDIVPAGVSLIQGKQIVIVDDVISTGSTLNECAKMLKQNGAREVIGLIIASD